MERDNLQERCATLGKRLMNGLHKLMEKHEVIGDVRGKGLMLGMELVTDRDSKEPAAARTAAVFEKARELGALIGKGGLDGNIIRIAPPMCITEADIDFLLEVLDLSFEQTA